ncbi:MAG: carbohydrate ABC transporter permease [Thermoprotei archaeon]|nr:MAG: carbohydrate ABC transporter permease [Thermoprotei archaeon]RLE56726.1 MAG: carbohydrate ABC transporter permease [Thermoprotei archaeon]
MYRGRRSVVNPYSYRIKRALMKAVIYGVMTAATIPLIMMYLWLFMQSISDRVLVGFIPTNFSIRGWRFLWQEIKFGEVTIPMIWPIALNSLIIAGGVTVFEVSIALLAGYALSRIEFPLRDKMLLLIIALHAFPGITLLIATFYLLHLMGLINTLFGVIIAKAAFEIPMAAWLIKGFFDAIPWDVEASALVDGCSRLQAWRKVILPLVKPGIAAVSIFAFLAGWNEFIFAYTFLFDPNLFPLSVHVLNLIGEFRYVDYSLLAATALFYCIPPLVFFVLTQKYLMQVQVGGVKGA